MTTILYSARLQVLLLSGSLGWMRFLMGTLTRKLLWILFMCLLCSAELLRVQAHEQRLANDRTC